MDGVVHNYIYASGKLLREVITTTTVTDEETTTETQVLDFFYDNNGSPFAVKIDDVVYYYITNLQGDVMNLVDANGTEVATYDYDPFGNVIATDGDLAAINPLRYRGYYYDSESSLYYLQSRYYDPIVGRFINADGYVSTGQGFVGYNMFAYCRNNPVTRKDSSGTDDVSVVDFNQDNNPLNDLGNPSGSGGGGNLWGSFMRTLKHAADGLKMASGQRDLTHVEDHHVISDKHSTKTIEYMEIVDRYNYSLDHPSNIVALPGHRGRHTNAYHGFITVAITDLDVLADGSTEAFIKGMEILGQFIKDTSWLPYAQYK